MTVANAGSVSQSYDGDRRAAYAVIEGGKVTIRRVEYGVESEPRELLDSGLPHAEWLSRILEILPPGDGANIMLEGVVFPCRREMPKGFGSLRCWPGCGASGEKRCRARH